jgi:hypothetical protein
VGFARFSGDGRWLAFTARRSGSPSGKQVFVAGFSIQDGLASDWIALTDGQDESCVPDWSPDGQRVYYLADRGGLVSVWCQAVAGASKQPVGAPREVYQFDQFRVSPINVGTHLVPFAVAQNQLVFCLGNSKANVFVGQLVRR